MNKPSKITIDSLIIVFFIFLLSILTACSKDEVPPVLDDSNSSQKGLNAYSIEHDNLIREYLLYIPESYDSTQNVPLLFVLHGFGGEASKFVSEADFRTIANQNNIIVVYPQGSELDGWPHWNAALNSKDNKSTVDDFGFFETLIDKLSSTYSIDSKRVYTCGYSNGGFMSFALGCFKSDRFAAVGSISGTMLEESYNECTPSHPTPVIVFHGTNDNVVPYAGGEGFTPIENVLNYWTIFNKTSTTPITEEVIDNGTTIEKYRYEEGTNNTSVEHFKVINGNHVWFEMDYKGKNTEDLIWDFFSQYSIDGEI